MALQDEADVLGALSWNEELCKVEHGKDVEQPLSRAMVQPVGMLFLGPYSSQYYASKQMGVWQARAVGRAPRQLHLWRWPRCTRLGMAGGCHWHVCASECARGVGVGAMGRCVRM